MSTCRAASDAFGSEPMVAGERQQLGQKRRGSLTAWSSRRKGRDPELVIGEAACHWIAQRAHWQGEI